MIELDLAAPLDRHRATVLPEWIDWNGHMNVGFYVVAFDKATDTLCEQFGCSWDYTREKIGMTFVLEAHVTYDREVKQGDPCASPARSSTTTPGACTSSTPCTTPTKAISPRPTS
jgi:acyl-CoA thioester hydrolase